MVHHERLNEACQRGESTQVLMEHGRIAEQCYCKALALCPPSALADLGSMHSQSGQFYMFSGESERARDHYERAIQCFEQTADHLNAGKARYGLALMYLLTEEQESVRRRDLLRRAAAYVQASLRDFQHYQGRAADIGSFAQGLIDDIARELAE